jgi:hypothetical protein
LNHVIGFFPANHGPSWIPQRHRKNRFETPSKKAF